MNGNGIRRRALRGIGGYFVSQPVVLLTHLAGVPLLLGYWGVNLYGEWLILSAIPAYLSISDLGFTSATVHAMTGQVAADDRIAALSSFRTSWWLISIVSVLVAGVVVIGAFTLPVADWLNLALLDDADIALLLSVLAVHVIISLQTRFLFAGYCCEGEYGQGHVFLSLGRLIEFLFIVVVVVAGYGPVGAAVAQLAGRIVIYAMMRWRLYRVAPWLRFGLSGFSRETARTLFGPAMGFTGYVVGNALNIQGPVLVIGALLGPVAVVPFATLRTLTRLVPQLLQSVSNIARPEIAIAVGRGEKTLVRRINHAACRVALWSAFTIGLGMYFLGDWVVSLWTSGRVVVEQPLFGLLLAVMLVNTLWEASGWVLQAINRVQRQATVFVLANILAIGVMFAVVERHGIEGAALTLLAAEITMAAAVFWQMIIYLEERPLVFLGAMCKPPLEIIRWLGDGEVPWNRK